MVCENLVNGDDDIEEAILSIQHFATDLHSNVVTPSFIRRHVPRIEYGCGGANALSSLFVMFRQLVMLFLEEECIVFNFAWLGYHQIWERWLARPLAPERIISCDFVGFLLLRSRLVLLVFHVHLCGERVGLLRQFRWRRW